MQWSWQSIAAGASLKNLFIFSSEIMKRLLIQVLVFLIPLMILAVGVESFVRTIPNSYRYKKEWMDSNKDSVRTLLLGNSHMFSAINPSLFSNAFNMANSAQSLEYDYWILSESIGRCPSLSTVILCIDDMNLYTQNLEDVEGLQNRVIYYNLYMGSLKYSFFSKYSYELTCPRFLCSKIEKYIVSKLTGKRFDIQCDSLGRGTYYHHNNQSLKKLSVRYIKKIMKNKLGLQSKYDNPQKGFDYLKRIAGLCDLSHIRFIIISTPYWYLYNEFGNREFMDKTNEALSKFCQRNKIEYRNYRKDSNFSYNINYFVDSHHLSDNGSCEFTKVIKHDFNLN